MDKASPVRPSPAILPTIETLALRLVPVAVPLLHIAALRQQELRDDIQIQSPIHSSPRKTLDGYVVAASVFVSRGMAGHDSLGLTLQTFIALRRRRGAR